MKTALLLSLLLPSPAFADGFCGHEASAYALDEFRRTEALSPSDLFFTSPRLVSRPNRGDRAEIWAVEVGNTRNGQRVGSVTYDVRVDSVSCALLSLLRGGK